MSETEKKIEKVSKEDIKAPVIAPGGTAIVLQRHERYERDRVADNSGSIFREHAVAARERDKKFFEDILAQERADGVPTKILFVSSDTQYNDMGYRSMETGQLAQDAAAEAFADAGIDPATRIINFMSGTTQSRDPKMHKATKQTLRPDPKLVEPKIFDVPEYVNFLRDKYGAEEGPGTGISQAAWAAHEADEEREVREQMGAEGVYDIVDRTRRSIEVMERYSRAFHHHNPNERLVIWAATHYDTISPLVKDATDTSFKEYVPVDYGGGVVINIEPGSHNAVLTAQSQQVPLQLGKSAVGGV